ncbi:hypothetical protein, partial [Acinetobacter baumannii]|uniref:hypothetical protein n=1 Tax=Acinetobacter baumannii TaxID=470 RepID=UPI001BC89939
MRNIVVKGFANFKYCDARTWVKWQSITAIKMAGPFSSYLRNIVVKGFANFKYCDARTWVKWQSIT